MRGRSGEGGLKLQSQALQLQSWERAMQHGGRGLEENDIRKMTSAHKRLLLRECFVLTQFPQPLQLRLCVVFSLLEQCAIILHIVL